RERDPHLLSDGNGLQDMRHDDVTRPRAGSCYSNPPTGAGAAPLVIRKQGGEAMSEATKLHQYESPQAKVTWDAARCIHAAECVRRLPQVFDPVAKPWIQPQKADA